MTLLHLEDFKIPENLARFAVRHGMWGVVQKMVPACSQFIDARRARGIAPNASDPHAYGAPSERPASPSGSGGGPRGTLSRQSSIGGESMCSEGGTRRTRIRRAASAVIAGGLVLGALGGFGSPPKSQRESDGGSDRGSRLRARDPSLRRSFSSPDRPHMMRVTS